MTVIIHQTHDNACDNDLCHNYRFVRVWVGLIRERERERGSERGYRCGWINMVYRCAGVLGNRHSINSAARRQIFSASECPTTRRHRSTIQHLRGCYLIIIVIIITAIIIPIADGFRNWFIDLLRYSIIPHVHFFFE